MIECVCIKILGFCRVINEFWVNQVKFSQALCKIIVKEELNRKRDCAFNVDFVSAHEKVSVLELSQTAPSNIVNT